MNEPLGALPQLAHASLRRFVCWYLLNSIRVRINWDFASVLHNLDTATTTPIADFKIHNFGREEDPNDGLGSAARTGDSFG